MYTCKSSASAKKCLKGCIKLGMWPDVSCFTILQVFNDITWGMLPHLMIKKRTKNKKKTTCGHQSTHESCFPGSSHVTLCMPEERDTGIPRYARKAAEQLHENVQEQSTSTGAVTQFESCRWLLGQCLLAAGQPGQKHYRNILHFCFSDWVAVMDSRGLSWGSVRNVSREHGQKITELPKLHTQTPHPCSIICLFCIFGARGKTKELTWLNFSLDAV